MKEGMELTRPEALQLIPLSEGAEMIVAQRAFRAAVIAVIPNPDGT
jgi:hypothetical protein